jgi:hypothetical protein
MNRMSAFAERCLDLLNVRQVDPAFVNPVFLQYVTIIEMRIA